MKLADIVSRYRTELESKYGSSLLPEQRQALDAITVCQTERAQRSLVFCPKCHRKTLREYGMLYFQYKMLACGLCLKEMIEAGLEKKD